MSTVIRKAGRSLLDLLTGPHGSDRYLELLHPRFASDRHLAEVLDVRRETADVVTLTMDPPAGWGSGALSRPRPGQAITLTVEVNGVRHRRAFSVASLTAASWTVTIKANATGIVSQHLVAHARTGLLLEVGAPFGELTLPSDRGLVGGLLLISGGSGITPVMAELRQLREEGRLAPVGSTLAASPSVLPRIAFLHYATDIANTIFLDELVAFAHGYENLDLIIVHTDDADGLGHPLNRGLTGFFDASHIASLDIDPATAMVHLCGPGPLAASVSAWIEDASGPTGGVTDRLRIETFYPPVALIDGDALDGTISLTTSDMALLSDGRSILEQAEGAGLRPEHGCRMGICHTCTRHVTSGSVRNLIDGTVETATGTSPVEARICVSAAHGDCAVDL
jgi:ferredoxin-NADP reductase